MKEAAARILQLFEGDVHKKMTDISPIFQFIYINRLGCFDLPDPNNSGSKTKQNSKCVYDAFYLMCYVGASRTLLCTFLYQNALSNSIADANPDRL